MVFCRTHLCLEDVGNCLVVVGDRATSRCSGCVSDRLVQDAKVVNPEEDGLVVGGAVVLQDARADGAVDGILFVPAVNAVVAVERVALRNLRVVVRQGEEHLAALV